MHKLIKTNANKQIKRNTKVTGASGFPINCLPLRNIDSISLINNILLILGNCLKLLITLLSNQSNILLILIITPSTVLGSSLSAEGDSICAMVSTLNPPGFSCESPTTSYWCVFSGITCQGNEVTSINLNDNAEMAGGIV